MSAERVKLSTDAASVLVCMPDWSAAWEIRDRMGYGRADHVERIAHSLVRRGLAIHHTANNTFRSTEAGRAALAGDRSDGGSDVG